MFGKHCVDSNQHASLRECLIVSFFLVLFVHYLGLLAPVHSMGQDLLSIATTISKSASAPHYVVSNSYNQYDKVGYLGCLYSLVSRSSLTIGSKQENDD